MRRLAGSFLAGFVAMVASVIASVAKAPLSPWRRFVFAVFDRIGGSWSDGPIGLEWPLSYLADGILVAVLVASVSAVYSSLPGPEEAPRRRVHLAIAGWGTLLALALAGWPSFERAARCERFLMHHSPPLDDARAAERLADLPRDVALPRLNDALASDCIRCQELAHRMLHRIGDPRAVGMAGIFELRDCGCAICAVCRRDRESR